jgi:hypothetical protein
MASLDDIPTLPPTTPTSDDLIAVIDGSDRRSPKRVSLDQLGPLIGGSVTAGSYAPAALVTAAEGMTDEQKQAFIPNTLEVDGVTLTDTSETTLTGGTLGLNAAGKAVIHDGEGTGGELNQLIDTGDFLRFRKEVAALSMNGVNFVAQLGEIRLSAAEAVTGKVLDLFGEIAVRWNGANKPDGGAYLFFGVDGDTISESLAEGFYLAIGTGVTSEARTIFGKWVLQSLGGGWVLSSAEYGPWSFVRKNSSGTVTLAMENSLAGGDIGHNDGLTGISGQPNRLQVWLATIDGGGAVNSFLSVSGFLSLKVG